MEKIPTYYKDSRNLLGGAKAAALWIRNPVSDDGAKQVYRMMYNLLGPDLHRAVRKLRQNPEVVQLLQERPDLGAALSDMPTLSQMPKGSVGHTYFEFMSGEDIFPGYILGGLAYKDGHFDRLIDWDEDVKWLIERMGNTHDITHVLAGYGSDFPGEAINISFTIAAAGAPAPLARLFGLFWGLMSGIGIMPSVGIGTWIAIHRDAVERGIAMASRAALARIPLEKLLPKPLNEVRRELGIPPHKHQHLVVGDGWLDSINWLRGWLGKNMANGFGTIDDTVARVKLARAAIENYHVPIKVVMGATRDSAEKAFELMERGEPRERVLATFKAASAAN